MNATRFLCVTAAVLFGAVHLGLGCGTDDAAGTGGTGAGASAASGGQSGLLTDAGAGADATVLLEVGASETSVSEVGDEACAAETVSAKRSRANMLFVLDRTGSMNCNPPPAQKSEDCELNPRPVDPEAPSKWDITSTAFRRAIEALEGTMPLPSVAIMFFNNDDDCGFPSEPQVPMAVLSGDVDNDPQLVTVRESLEEVVPRGSTPIIGALMSAYFFLHDTTSLDGIKVVVLLTDGAETCDPDSKTMLVAKAADALSVGIRTFVLGAPGSEPERAFLSQIAYEGGTATSPTCDHSGGRPHVGDCHMDMTLPGMDFAAVLRENLERISAQALSCEFEVPKPEPGQPPVDPTKVNVVYTHGDGAEEYVPQDLSLACSDPGNKGWQYSEGGTRIALCGQACERVRSDPGASISIALGCQTQVIPK